MTKDNAIGYVRVSRIAGREGDSFLSPDLQRESIERTCKREGLTLIDVLEEFDKSGADNTRPLWNEAIERIERGEAQALVVWNLDRFSRSIIDGFNAINRIEGAGGTLHSEEGETGKIGRGMRFIFAETNRDLIKETFRRSTIHAIERGVYISARVPFGYIKDKETKRLVPDPETAPTVVELFERRVKGHSWVKLADWLRENGGSSTTTRTSVRGIVHNRAYLGEARQGDITNRKAHPRLVSQKLFDEAAKKGTAPRHDGSVSSQTLFSPTCGNCGHRMQANRSQGKRLPDGKREKIVAYSCLNRRCDARAYMKASELDPWVVGNLFTLLERVGTVGYEVPGTNPGDRIDARKQLEAAEYDRKLWIENREIRRQISAEEYNNELSALIEAVTKARIALEMAEYEFPEVENIKALWREWPMDTKREWLRKVVTSIVVEPARGKRAVSEIARSVAIIERVHITYSFGWQVGKASSGLRPDDETMTKRLHALGHKGTKLRATSA